MELRMPNLIPQTARQGRSQSGNDLLAKNLGYFSIALGVAELLAPRAVCRAAGITGLESLIKACGAREIATGVAILTSHDPEPWIWGRVAGDMADLATVATGLGDDNNRRENSMLALAALAAVTLVDVVCASRLTGEKGGRKTAIADYTRRSGFPQGVHAARGAAQDFKVPADFRIPEALRPWVDANATKSS
jgi:hypothetical protein